MKLPAIITTDLHFTANPTDAYRWGLFSWLKEQAREYDVQTVAILGDITDAKDYHPSVLVNKVVSELQSLQEVVPTIDILEGNHDYLKDGNPYFSFLNAMPGVRFIHRITDDLAEDDDWPVLWLPHSKNPAKDWAGFKDLSWFSCIFMHQTMTGSHSSNGQELEGEGVERLSWFTASSDLPLILSGDVHVPQKCGLVEYVGSPYPVHFGDTFTGRCILVRRDGSRKNLYFPTIGRPSFVVKGMDDLRTLSAREGDQVKVKVLLSRSEQQDWPLFRKRVQEWAARARVELCGVTLELEKERRRLSSVAPSSVLPGDVLLEFVRSEGLTADAYAAGMEVL